MLDADQVKVVGLAIGGMAQALARHHQGPPPALPEHLKRYFDQQPAAREWHPLPDYLELIDMFVSVAAPAEQRLDVCWLLGSYGGKRDAGVTEAGEAVRERDPYFQVSLDARQGIPVVVRRALRMRERYYNRGYYKVERVGTAELLITLHQFPASAELCAMSTGYLRELLHSAGIGARIRRTACAGLGEDGCRWQLTFKPGADVSSLSAFD